MYVQVIVVVNSVLYVYLLLVMHSLYVQKQILKEIKQLHIHIRKFFLNPFSKLIFIHPERFAPTYWLDHLIIMFLTWNFLTAFILTTSSTIFLKSFS